MSTIIAVRVPKRLKEEMKKVQEVNWSEVLRQAIEEKIRREKLRELGRSIDQLKACLPPSTEPDFSTRSIRADRGR